MERIELEQWKGREVARLLALVESERRYYQEIVASIPVGLLVVSHDLSIVSSNRAARRILGLRSSEPMRGRLDTLLPAEVVGKIQSIFEQCERIDNIMAEHGGRSLRLSVLPIRNGDEEHQYEALVSIENLTGAPAPAPIETAAELSEIKPEVTEEPAVEAAPEAPAPAPAAGPTAEPSSEPAAAEALELLQSLDAIIWAAEVPSMNFLFVTNGTEEILGFPSDHWLNTPGFWSGRIHPEDRDAVLNSYQEAIENGHRHRCEFRSHASDGHIVWLRETARILTDGEGKPKHVIGLTIDVTERRRLEEHHVRAERMDALGKLASRLSHDLNNMLMIVNGYGEELLHNVAKNDPLRADVQEILTATNRIGALTNELLAFTRRQPVAAEILDLSEVVMALQDALARIAGSTMTIEIETDPGLQAKAGRPQLDQLLTNLAMRARAAMKESGREGGKLTISMGEVHIHEDLRSTDHVLAPGTYAVVTFEDQAGPLSHDAQMALFESILPAREMPVETGSILSRSYTFVRQWGGDISVESTASGSRVSIFLPYAGRKDATAVPAAEPEPEPVAPMEPPAPAAAEEPELETILVVEDEGGIRALVRKILRRQGYTVFEASNGDEARKLCAEHGGKIDLLITDVMMPNMSGRELVDTLKKQCGQMKVLYVSGYTDDAAIYAGDFPPGTAFLQKPFTLGSLLDKVKEVLNQ